MQCETNFKADKIVIRQNMTGCVNYLTKKA